MGNVDDLLTAKEVAQVLDITRKHVTNLVRRGDLTPCHRSGYSAAGKMYFKLEHVLALKQARVKNWSTTEAVVAAKQAQAEVRSLRAELERIKTCMGVRIKGLDFSALAVREVYERVDYALNSPPQALKPEEVWSWASLFYAIGEEYFEVVELYIGDNEPWKVFLQLGQKLVREAPKCYDKELEIAYGYLAMARRMMRQSAYFYIRNKYGKRVSGQMFPEMEDEIISPVILMAFHDLQP